MDDQILIPAQEFDDIVHSLLLVTQLYEIRVEQIPLTELELEKINYVEKLLLPIIEKYKLKT